MLVSPSAADSLPCCVRRLKVLVFWAMEGYNGGNEFGQVGAVRGDSVKVFCFRRVAKFGIDNSTMLMLVCQVFSRTSITTVLYFGALDYLY